MDSLVLPIAAASVLLLALYLPRKNSHPLPPGPPRLPILGNLLSFPKHASFKTYFEWSKLYRSDVIYLDVLGSPIVVINSVAAAKELLEHPSRSKNYASRPPLHMVNDLMAFSWDIGFKPYGDDWRAARRVIDREFRPVPALRFRPFQTRLCHTFLSGLLENPAPEDVMADMRHMAGATILSLAYGITIQPKHDPILEIAETLNKSLLEAMAEPMTFAMETFPSLRYLVKLLPGLRASISRWRKSSIDMLEIPYAEAKRAIDERRSTESLVSAALENLDPTEDMHHQEDIIKGVAATLYSAGADTTVATLGSFILNMLAYPEIQKRVHEEIDACLDGRRLPTFEDDLPFTTAVFLETERHDNVAPLAIPHFTDVEDIYNGYRIPAKSTVVTNLWGMLHDENIYPEPFAFNPDRFMKDGKLNPDVLNPEAIIFGFGRRMCPGRYLANSSMWITVTTLMALFEIRKTLDQHGNEVEPSYKYAEELTITPVPFKCRFLPRFDVKEIMEVLDE
ncbi:cytochrome P450 [Mycena floridula]|nr:cytochrome P450 [Mycena floridula]